jgi:hypothetical protein
MLLRSISAAADSSSFGEILHNINPDLYVCSLGLSPEQCSAPLLHCSIASCILLHSKWMYIRGFYFVFAQKVLHLGMLAGNQVG